MDNKQNKKPKEIEWRASLIRGSAFFITAFIGGAAAALGSKVSSSACDYFSKNPHKENVNPNLELVKNVV